MPVAARGAQSISRDCQGAGRAAGAFPGECCFQVIYFNSNISFVAPIETCLAAGVETTRLTARG
jgi:hypothetical protein